MKREHRTLPMRKVRLVVLLAVLLSQVPLRCRDASGVREPSDVPRGHRRNRCHGAAAGPRQRRHGRRPGRQRHGRLHHVQPGAGRGEPGHRRERHGRRPGLVSADRRATTSRSASRTCASRPRAPVFALGFEIVEPDATMPAWGGTAVDSSFQIRLFLGGVSGRGLRRRQSAEGRRDVHRRVERHRVRPCGDRGPHGQ